MPPQMVLALDGFPVSIRLLLTAPLWQQKHAVLRGSPVPSVVRGRGLGGGCCSSHASMSTTPPSVDIRFIKASQNSITLDLRPGPGSSSGAQIERFELQWRRAGAAASADGRWMTASSSLKLRRCTKGNLQPGSLYTFRARACTGDAMWGPYGAATEPLSTTLPSVPSECSEALRVPALVAVAASQRKAAEHESDAREAARKDADLTRFVSQKSAAAREVRADTAQRPPLAETGLPASPPPPSPPPRLARPPARPHRACKAPPDTSGHLSALCVLQVQAAAERLEARQREICLKV